MNFQISLIQNGQIKQIMFQVETLSKALLIARQLNASTIVLVSN